MRKPDRPKDPTVVRLWLVKFKDGQTVEVEAEYRGAARHYAKRELIAPSRHYPQVASARLKREVV